MISMLYAVSCTFFVLLAVAFFSWSTEVKFILLILFFFPGIMKAWYYVLN